MILHAIDLKNPYLAKIPLLKGRTNFSSSDQRENQCYFIKTYFFKCISKILYLSETDWITVVIQFINLCLIILLLSRLLADAEYILSFI